MLHTHPCLPDPCVHISRVGISKSRGEFISGLKGVRIRMGRHIVYNDGCVNSDDVICRHHFRVLAMYVTRQNSG